LSRLFKKDSVEQGVLEEGSGGSSASKSYVEEDVTPRQYRVRPDDQELSIPFRISRFVDYGGTTDKRQINTMAYIATFLCNSRSEWFPKLSEYQPVPRNLPIKGQVSRVGRLVYEKGINNEVFRAFLDKSESIEELLRFLESTQNRRTLYSRKM